MSNDTRDALNSIADTLKELLVLVKEARAEEKARTEENAKPTCSYCQSKFTGDFDAHLTTCDGYARRPFRPDPACDLFVDSNDGIGRCATCRNLAISHERHVSPGAHQ